MLVIPTMDQGGAEKQLSLLAAGLPSDRFEVSVVLLTRGGPLEPSLLEAGVTVVHCDKKWKLDPLAYFRLKEAIKRFRPDIVHTWIFAANCYGRAAAWRLKVPVVLGGERCVDLWKRSYEFMLDRFLAKRTDGILTNSEGVKNFYAQHGISAERFHIIPNGVEVKTLERQPAREALLNKLQLPGTTRLIGVVGRLWPQKRLKDAIWATELLKCVRDDTHLLIAGDGPQRWRLEKFAEQVGVDPFVHFLGHVEHSAPLIAALDQFWICSGYEGQSNSLMEAMSQGIPVIASDIPGNRDLVVHEETGLLFPLGDRAELAKQSERLSHDPEFASQLALAGREKVQRDFSVEKMVQRHMEYYESRLREAASVLPRPQRASAMNSIDGGGKRSP